MDTFGEIFSDPEEDTDLYGKAPVHNDRRSYQSVGFEEDRRGPESEDTQRSQRVFCRDDGVDGLHADNLFDENGDVYGGIADEGTGLPIDNSTFTDEQAVLKAGGYLVELGADGEEPVEPVLGDHVDQWIANQERLQAGGSEEEIVA